MSNDGTLPFLSNLFTESACDALCQSRKFETGQGTCAAICMSKLGAARAGDCPHAKTVFFDLAMAIADNYKERLKASRGK